MRTLLLGGLLLCCSCTQDFGAFAFERGDAGADSGAPSDDPDAANPASTAGDADASASQTGNDGDSAVAPGDGGGVDASYAGEDAATRDQVDAGGSDAAPDAATPDAGGDAGDAGDGDALQLSCSERFTTELAADSAQCAVCGCDACARSLLDCIAPDDGEDALCAAVLTCALENGCHDWDCYCTAPPCGSPDKSGDGPCSAEMDAAAGGTRVQVDAIRSGGDTTEPLVRAMNAIDCTVGLHARSPGGPTDGMCETECSP